MPRSTAKYDGILISPPIFITATNTSGHRKLYPVFRDKADSKVHLVQCDECGRFISLPGNKSLVKMERHVRSKECANLKTKNERWKVQEQVRAEAEAALLSSGLVHRLADPPARPRVQPRPIVEAQSLMNASGSTMTFSIPLHTTGLRSVNSPFGGILDLSIPAPPPARSPRAQARPQEEIRRSPRNTVTPTTVVANVEERQPHSGNPPHPTPRLFQDRGRVSEPTVSSVSDFSSDSEDDSVSPSTRRSATAEESELDISDAEVEDISRRARRHAAS